jgi:hypothetical protein
MSAGGTAAAGVAGFSGATSCGEAGGAPAVAVGCAAAAETAVGCAVGVGTAGAG